MAVTVYYESGKVTEYENAKRIDVGDQFLTLSPWSEGIITVINIDNIVEFVPEDDYRLEGDS